MPENSRWDLIQRLKS